MASSSPFLGRGRGSGPARAETSSRTMVGLQRVNAQLQQELDKIDRQAFTAVSNITNHQQAMKMSWRRLESQRNRTGSCPDQTSPAAQRRGLLMSSNKTRLYVSATPQIYSGGGGHGESQSQPQLARGSGPGGEAAAGPSVQISSDDSSETSRSSSRVSSRHHGSLLAPIASSPYVSSPYMYRRSSSPDPVAVSSSASSKPPPPVSPLTNTSSPSSVKLPPILSSSSQPSLVATTNKDTLLKVSHMMGLDSTSQGPKSFHGFYTERATHHHPAEMVVQSSPNMTEASGNYEGGEGEGEREEGGELSLAEQFEQIRHCRYIRHYRPDGTAVDDPYELDH